MGVGTRTDIMHGNMNELEVCWWWRRKVTWRLVSGLEKLGWKLICPKMGWRCGGRQAWGGGVKGEDGGGTGAWWGGAGVSGRALGAPDLAPQGRVSAPCL